MYLQVLGSVFHIWDLVWSGGNGMSRKKLSLWVRGAGGLYPLLWMYVLSDYCIELQVQRLRRHVNFSLLVKWKMEDGEKIL